MYMSLNVLPCIHAVILESSEWSNVHTINPSSMTDEAHGERSKESIRSKCAQYLERTEQLKKFLVKKGKKVNASGPTTSKLVIVQEKPNVHWDDVAGLHMAKDTLKNTFIFPIRFPHLFKGQLVFPGHFSGII